MKGLMEKSRKAHSLPFLFFYLTENDKSVTDVAVNLIINYINSNDMIKQLNMKKRIEQFAPLCEQEWKALIASGDARLMRQYFSYRNDAGIPSIETEIQLVRSGNAEMLEIYCDDDGGGDFELYDEAIKELISSGNIEMIRAYIKHHPLSPDFELALIRLGNDELIDFYSTRFGFYTHVEEELERIRTTSKIG